MKKQKILFIGGGNMARAIVAGLIQQGFNANNIYVVDRNQDKRHFFSQTYQIQVAENWQAFVNSAEVIFLAVKPQGAKELCHELANALENNSKLIVSVMAGITTELLNRWLGPHLAIIRTMPNTPSRIQLGATGLFANALCSAEQKATVESLMQAIGITAWLNKEQDIDSITALSGSGPAYYFYFMEIMQNAAIDMGIEAETARDFAIQTAYGAAKLALDSKEDLTNLRAQVTSKKGTTEAALNNMQQQHIDSILKNAMKAAVDRSIELSEMFKG